LGTAHQPKAMFRCPTFDIQKAAKVEFAAAIFWTAWRHPSPSSEGCIRIFNVFLMSFLYYSGLMFVAGRMLDFCLKAS
jgi:hypothetical protein